MSGNLYCLLAFFTSGEKGGLLSLNPGLIFWTVVIFLILLVLLKKYAWKPILSALDEREEFIKNSLDRAESAKEEAEKLLAQNNNNLLKAQEESQKIITQGREYAEKLKEQIIEESKQEARKIIEQATLEISRKNLEAFNKLKAEVADITIAAAEKILKENLDKEKNTVLVNKYIDELQRN